MLTGEQHGMMLDARSNDVIARAGQSHDCQIVALGPTAGEDDLRDPTA